MAKSIARKASKKSVARKSRKLVSKRSKKSVSKISKKSRTKRSKKSKRSSPKRVSYRMMPAARPALFDEVPIQTIPVLNNRGNIFRYVDYEPRGDPYMRLTMNGRGHPFFYRSYEEAAMAAFAPSAMSDNKDFRPDPRVWVLSNDGSSFVVTEE